MLLNCLLDQSVLTDFYLSATWLLTYVLPDFLLSWTDNFQPIWILYHITFNQDILFTWWVLTYLNSVLVDFNIVESSMGWL